MIQNFTKKHAGFTLVELLVVIAIIGLLASIVLVSFGPIRTTARDTAIKANMGTMRLASELTYANNATYVGANNRTDYIAANNAVNAAGGTSYGANFSANAYCIKYVLPGGGNWCIDSGGNIGNSPGNCVIANWRCE